MSGLITVERALRFQQRCGEHSRTALTELLGGGLTPEQLLRKRIVADEKVWFAACPGVLTRRQRAAWLRLFVGRAVRRAALHCGVPEVEAWAEKYLSGEDRRAWSAHGVALEAEYAGDIGLSVDAALAGKDISASLAVDSGMYAARAAEQAALDAVYNAAYNAEIAVSLLPGEQWRPQSEWSRIVSDLRKVLAQGKHANSRRASHKRKGGTK